MTAMREAIGRYRVERRLGEGGMGVVFAAHDEQLGRSVAIKTIKGGAADLAVRERLRREARVAAGLNHPGICQVFEIGEDDNELYIVMELLEGESLASRMARGAIPVDRPPSRPSEAPHARPSSHD